MSSPLKDTRIRILEATLLLLESGQAQSVRMTDIAKRAGISRQAVYLHFPTRAALLVATTQYVDELKGVEKRLRASRSAGSGVERLEAYVDAWCSYIPEIYGIAKALLAMRDTDAAAAEAWDERMQDMREGCEAAVTALARDALLSEEHSVTESTDLLWTMLSIRNWELLTIDCGWSQERYLRTTKALARRALIKSE